MRVISAVMLSGLVAGCVASGTQVGEDQLAKFERGKTTMQEVVRALGQPNGNSVLLDGSRMLTYVYFKASPRPENFIPVVGAFVGGVDTTNNSVVLKFNSGGVLENYQSSSGNISGGFGLEAGAPNPRMGPTEAPPK